MRRALFAIAALAAAGPALAQSDRYGGYAGSVPMTLAQQGRVMTWTGKQGGAQQYPQYPQQQAYPTAYPQGPNTGYPQQQAYPTSYPQQQAYPQQAPPQQAYPQAYPQPYSPMNQAGLPPPPPGPVQGAPRASYGQPGQGQEGVILYPSISAGSYGQQNGPRYQDARYGNTRNSAPPYANQPPPVPQYPPGAYPQYAYPQMMTPPTGYVPTGFVNQQQAFPAAAYPQSYQVQQPQQPQGAQAMPPPQGAWQMQGQPQAQVPGQNQGQSQNQGQGGSPVMAAPTTPVTSQPLPTSIYAPTPPRAENDAAPAGDGQTVQADGPTAVASLDSRSVPRHYSVHRPFGIDPDPAPPPSKVSNQVLMAAEAENPELFDPGLAGFRGVGEDEEEAAPAAKPRTNAKKAKSSGYR